MYDDLEFLINIRNQYCEEYLHDSRKFTLEDAQKWYKEKHPSYLKIIFDGVDIGYVRLTNDYNDNLYVGVDISPEYTGKGYGYQTYIELLPLLFNYFAIDKVYLEVLSTNERAIHLYEKIGFKVDGIKKAEVLKKDTYVDSIIMSFSKSDLKWEI